MGSSGGGYSNYGSGGLGAQERASAKNAQSSQIEMEINQFLDSLLKEINARDADAIRTHIAEIEKALGKEIDGLDTLLYGGSLSKSTFVEGMSDVDALVFFDKESYQNTSPRDLQDKMFSLLKTRYPNTEIKKGTLAVTVKFKDYTCLIIPRRHALFTPWNLSQSSSGMSCTKAAFFTLSPEEKPPATNN